MSNVTPPIPLKCSLRDWGALRAGLLFITERTHYDPADNRAIVRHGEYSAWLIRQGWASVRVGNEVTRATPGQWLFCFAKELSQELSPDLRMLSVRMSASWPDETGLFVDDRSVLVLQGSEHPQLEFVARALIADIGPVEQFSEDPAFTFHWRTRLDLRGYLAHQSHVLQWTTLVHEILTAHGWQIEIPGGIDTRLASALDIIDHLPLHAPFPATALPRASGLTLGQLNRLCLKACKMSVHGYWEYRRVQHAQYRLGQPASSIKATAAELGFTQLSHFSAWFKRHVGKPPRAYRGPG